MEKFFDVKVVFVQFGCPQCEKGMLAQSGQPIAGLNGALSIPHKCNNELCGFGQSFPNLYPHIRQIVGAEIKQDDPAPVPSVKQRIENMKKIK